MRGTILYMWVLAATLTATGQTRITFDTADYGSLGVYDTWEQSPFRNGNPRLRGNVRVIDNCFRQTPCGVGNTSGKILALQRSRFGSNTFGARIGLPSPLYTSEKPLYVHVLVHKPNTSKVMLVGLGKRESFAEAPDSIEQFWTVAAQTPVAGEWFDMVFPVRTVSGVRLSSLVVVPDLASPHNLKHDFACYIDEIEINSDPRPRASRGAGAVARKKP